MSKYVEIKQRKNALYVANFELIGLKDN